jgi:hypothetical protein
VLCEATPLPRIEAVVTEYRQYTVECPAFETHNTAEWPKDMPTGGFGSRCRATRHTWENCCTKGATLTCAKTGRTCIHILALEAAPIFACAVKSGT